MKNLQYLIAALFLCAVTSYAQVGVYPMAIFMDNNSKSGELLLSNSSKSPQEVNISLKFGYPSTDSSGNLSICYTDSLYEKEKSLTPYVSFFPKKLVLAPGQSQSVRILVKNSSALSDGAYFGRILTTAKEPDKKLDSTTNDKVQVGFKFEFTMVSALIFEKGAVNADLKINNCYAKKDTAKTLLFFGVDKLGNAPFWGKGEIKIFNDKGESVEEISENFAMYKSGLKAFALKNTNLPAGTYKAVFTISNEQEDIPEDFKTKFEKRTTDHIFTIQ
jgi:hypothetical protein